MDERSLKKLYEIDELQMYFGRDFRINEHIIIHQPSLGDIVTMGERNYFSMVHRLTAIPSDMIAELHLMNLDWNKVEEFELFSMMIMSMDIEDTRPIFGDLDFREFKIVPIEGQRRHVLRHERLGFDFDELQYKAMTNYLRKMHGLKRKPQVAGNESTRKMMIEMALEDREIAQRKPYKSQMRDLISAAVNSAGFKYNLQQVQEMTLCQFMDCISRLQIIRSAEALLHGCYSGMINTKKIKKDELNCMRSVSE